jgi:hypothetical protein
MNQTDYQIETFWDESAQVWIATSEDVFGLATEANNWEDLMLKLKIIIPELLIVNKQTSTDYQGEISLTIISRRQELIKVA